MSAANRPGAGHRARGRLAPSGPPAPEQGRASRARRAAPRRPASPILHRGRESRARRSARGTGLSAPQHLAPVRGQRAPCCSAWGPGLSLPHLGACFSLVGRETCATMSPSPLRHRHCAAGVAREACSLTRALAFCLPYRLFHRSPWPFSAWTASSSPRPRMTSCTRSRRSWTASCCRSSCQSKLGRGRWRGAPCGWEGRGAPGPLCPFPGWCIQGHWPSAGSDLGL